MPILLLNVKCGSEWECVLFCVLSGVYVCLFSTFASMLIFRAILFLELVHVLNFHYETWLTNFLSRTVQKRYERGSEINGMIRYFCKNIYAVIPTHGCLSPMFDIFVPMVYGELFKLLDD